MKKIILSVISTIAFMAFQCHDVAIDLLVPCNEGVAATVRDLTGLDGCGYVFELEDGTRLQPYMIGYCGTPPLPKEVTEDPLYGFDWVDGKRVKIGYESTKALSACMNGIVVKVTCLEEMPPVVDTTR